MERKTISVPEGTQYLSELVGKELPDGLPHGIFNKSICDCGATTLALVDEHKTIICSPRVRLIDNKHKQHPKTLVVKKGVVYDEITDYLHTADIPKILVTYDSLPRVIDCISDTSDWRVVIDEFHFLLLDSSFKSETEFKTLECLKRMPYVTYLSATPLLDKYICEIEQFKDLPYTELKWEKSRRIKVNRVKAGRPIDAALAIVKRYMQGQFPSVTVDGAKYVSSECVIFLNSVTNIVNIIKKSGLKASDVNIIVADTDGNAKMVAKLGNDFEIGTIPIKGENHKMVTLCTSTAYAGCDFYSTCASTYVICSSNRACTSVDIGTELQQIAGRQRLPENKFRDMLTFIYSTSVLDLDEETFNKRLFGKVDLTNETVEAFNKLPEIVKNKQKHDTMKLQKMMQYGEDYTMYDEKTDSFVFNNMAYLYERFAYELQKIYANGVTVKQELKKNNFDLDGNQQFVEKFNEQVECVIKRDSFRNRMKRYCESQEHPLVLSLIEESDDRIKYYYQELGAERCKALGYKESALRNEVELQCKTKSIKILLSQVFFPSMQITTEQIKKELAITYAKLGIKKAAVASDLKKYGYEMKPTKVVVDGVRKNGFVLQ